MGLGEVAPTCSRIEELLPEACVKSGTRSDTGGGGKPADNGPDGVRAARAIGLPLRPLLTNGALPREGTCVRVVPTEEEHG